MYKIKENTQYKSKEVYFDAKPSEAARNALKSMKFRWNPQKGCWYGFSEDSAIAAALDGEATTLPANAKKKNKYGVEVGDIFSASWGYDQTNVDFFQVIALVGESSVRVREVLPSVISESATGPMSADRTYKLTHELLPPASFSVFIKDQNHGDLKRIQGTQGTCYINLGHTSAHQCHGETVTEYVSWYA